MTIHLPLSEKTEDLINKNLLSTVEKERRRLLVNTSRSGIVADVVYDQIGDGTFDAAGLDVFPEDLPTESPDRIYFTPHTAGITQEASYRMREEVLGKLESKL